MVKDHTVRKGMKFLFSNILREELVLLVMVVLCVLLTLASSVLMVYIPSYAVAVVGSDADSPQWTGVILITVAYVVVSCACSGVQGGRGMRQLYMGRNLLYRLFLRRLDAKYEYTESDVGQKAYKCLF